MAFITNSGKTNMYHWVSHMHTHLRGRCPHECTYCYAIHCRASKVYSGPQHLRSEELNVKYGKDKTIFIEHMADLFAYGVSDDNIKKILMHCREYPLNLYVFQTRNPGRMLKFTRYMPPHYTVGTTIETNREELTDKYSKAPSPLQRAEGMKLVRKEMRPYQTFLTVEPVLDFDVVQLVDLIETADPEWVNIGADSKNCGLIEPSAEKIRKLIEYLYHLDIEISNKTNLERILGT